MLCILQGILKTQGVIQPMPILDIYTRSVRGDVSCGLSERHRFSYTMLLAQHLTQFGEWPALVREMRYIPSCHVFRFGQTISTEVGIDQAGRQDVVSGRVYSPGTLKSIDGFGLFLKQ